MDLPAAVDLAVEETEIYDKDGWCTPTEYIEMAREVMGGIDVDPASNDYAQQRIKAATYYTKETNGLDKEWNGRVWMNPPYSATLVKAFTSKFLEEWEEERTTQGIVLVNTCADTKWYHRLLKACSALCLVEGRIQFDHPERDSPAPRCASTFFYFGFWVNRFEEVFGKVGTVLVP